MSIFRIIIFFTICSYTTQSIGQNEDTVLRRTYVKLSDWKKLNKKAITKQDSLDFLIRNNDTLVLIDGDINFSGVSVPYTYKDSTFLDLYSRSAFRLKNDSKDHKRTTKYWKKTLKVFFADHVSGNIRRDFKNFAKTTISLIDSLSIDFVRKVEDSNIIIYYKDDYDYESRMNKKQNGAYYMHWTGSRITKLSIYINNTYFFSDKLRSMEIKRLFIMGLGHFELLYGLPCNSYFSSCISQEKELTDLDVEFLQYHYDYGICKGTDLKTFREQHHTAKELLKKDSNNKMRFRHHY